MAHVDATARTGNAGSISRSLRAAASAFGAMVAGIMKLVRNSGEISTWSVQAVYENDTFDFCLGDEEHITHKPALANRGKLIAVYSIVTMKDGEKSREVMSVEDVNQIRARSRSGQSGPWVSDFAEMAKKTVVRRHSKRLPLSTDIDGMIKEDDELFMPEQPAQPAQEAPQAAETPSATRRPSRLQKVAEQAPEQAHADDDGVIDQIWASTYVHQQPAPSAVWNINHSLGVFPSVDVMDSSDTVVYADVQHTSMDSLTVTFASPTTGRALLRR